MQQKILFVKTSSIGDVVHHMPAVVDARQRYPSAFISWAVEEDCAPLAALHPAVDEVIPIAWRRWRKSLWRLSTWREIHEVRRRLRSLHFNTIIDAQGRFRSGLIAWISRGERHGYSSKSRRSRFVPPFFYNVHHCVARDAHAIMRNKLLTGMALKYLPSDVIDYGLKGAPPNASTAKRAVLLHSTVKAKKLWAEQNWIELGKDLNNLGYTIILPWGTEIEKARSVRLAAELDAEVPDREPLDQFADRLTWAALVVGMDTGLLHLTAALKVPLVGIYVGSNPERTGPAGIGPIEITGSKGRPPSAKEVLKAVEKVAAR